MNRILATLLTVLLLGFTALAQAAPPHVVMLIAEREYETDKTLPSFVKQHLSDRYQTTLVFADSEDPNRFVGIEAVGNADVLLVSVRRRALPPDQLDLIRGYVSAGKPVIGIRTASHAFSLRGKEPPQGRAVWPQWDQQVFGGNYTNHYGNSLQATVVAEPQSAVAKGLLRDIDPESFVAGGSLYKVSPLAKGADAFLFGRVADSQREPVAWTFVRGDGGKSFYTSLGHVDDFRGDVLPQLLVNAIDWSLASQH